LLLRLLKKAKLADSWYIEYKVKDENEPRYQVLSPMSKYKLKQYIHIFLVQEQNIQDVSYFFFDALSADIESIKLKIMLGTMTSKLMMKLLILKLIPLQIHDDS
jgi:hypothetical protein